MSLTTPLSVTATRNRGLLAARVAAVLAQLDRKQGITDDDRYALVGAEEMVDEFIVGSRLVEGDLKGGITPSADSVNAFRSALTTLDALHRISANGLVSKALEEISLTVKAAQSDRVDVGRLRSAHEFFAALATMLDDDLARRRLDEAGAHRDRSIRGHSEG